MLFKSIVVVSLLTLLLTSCTTNQTQLPTCTQTDCDCSDFSSQSEAQFVLEAFDGDPYKLDGDRNGLACESLPGAIARTNPTPITKSNNVHLQFGNPSNASGDHNNYLINRPQYALSYNCSEGIANWVSWQLDSSWLGSVERSDDFRPDPDLPDGCYAVRPNDYRGSGYDRGHLVPSGDRTSNQSNNSATFYMTNMIPQSPANNREVWRELEEYSRELVRQGKELYIVAGGEGRQEAIGQSPPAKLIANGRITVPQYTWKVILVSDDGNVEQTIAVRIPNNESVANSDWTDYLVSVDEIERLTGYDFFDKLSISLQQQIER